ncbi:hypothetical protein CFC21_006945, partial [Triticum aestivum]
GQCQPAARRALLLAPRRARRPGRGALPLNKSPCQCARPQARPPRQPTPHSQQLRQGLPHRFPVPTPL